MKIKKITPIFIIFLLIFSCAEYERSVKKKLNQKKIFSSSGFALIYEPSLYKGKIVNKKINNDKFEAMHSFLKPNTHIKLYNPKNSKFIIIKIKKNAIFPNIYNLVITKKTADFLELDYNNPFIEAVEFRINKTFVAKKATTFDEEKQVANKAPVGSVEINSISQDVNVSLKDETNELNFVILISDFYYLESAVKLKKKLIQEGEVDNLLVKKLAHNKFRLTAGPFKNFNALKNTYSSLNSLGFNELSILKK